MSLTTGTLRVTIAGTLQDIVNNFQTLLNDLTAQGVDISQFQSTRVEITVIQGNVSQGSFNSVESALATFKTTATSIVVIAEFLIRG